MDRSLIDVVENAYRLDGDEESWLQRLLASAPGFHGALTCETDAETGIRLRHRIGGPDDDDGVDEANRGLPLSWWASPGPVYESARQRAVRLMGAHEGEALLDTFPWPPGVRDILGIGAIDASGLSVTLCAFLPEPLEAADRRARHHWELASAHMLAGLRLRAALDDGDKDDAQGRSDPAEEAVLTPDGSCVHATGPARSQDSREALRASVRDIHRARGPLRNEDTSEALRIWRGLVSGQWSLVDRFDSDGRRHFVARRNDVALTDPRALSLRERQVVAYARLGRSNKLIAYTLGLSTSTVATHLATALRKLGLQSRVELTTVPATDDEPPDPQ